MPEGRAASITPARLPPAQGWEDQRDTSFRQLLDVVRTFNRRPSLARRQAVVMAARKLAKAYEPDLEDLTPFSTNEHWVEGKITGASGES